MVNFTQVPYNASLIAHENMSIYAYVGLYDAFSRLAIAYLLSLSPMDDLVFYALLLMLNTFLIQFFIGFIRIGVIRSAVSDGLRIRLYIKGSWLIQGGRCLADWHQ